MLSRYSRVPRFNALAAATMMACLSLSATHAVAADPVQSSGSQAAEQYDRFIVKYRTGTAKRDNADNVKRALSGSATMQFAGSALRLKHLRRLALGADVIRTSRKFDRVEAAAFMRQLKADPDIEYIEPDAWMQPTATKFTPNDTSYSNQWGYNNTTAGIDADRAWEASTGDGIVVAVIDTGITPHSDLNRNVLAGYDFISDKDTAQDGDERDANADDPGDGYTASACGPNQPRTKNSSWHGTHVAGTVAAITDNAQGVAGTAYGARILPVRALGRCGGRVSDIADAITWASGGVVADIPRNTNPAEVINLSLGGSGECGPTYQDAIDGAVGRGTTVVVAAGNGGTDVSDSRPANCGGVIAVGAVDRTGSRSVWNATQSSNFGAGVDIAAPGSDIRSTINTGALLQVAEGYGSKGGTSMAAPHVAGIVALMQAAVVRPLTPSNVEAMLKTTVRPFPEAQDPAIGKGIANAWSAVATARGVLANGKDVYVSGERDSDRRWTLAVPPGAQNLRFATTGGTGNADLYVRFNAEPTLTDYDCRPHLDSNAEACDIAPAQEGTYHVWVRGAAEFAGVTLRSTYTPATYNNTEDVAIRDDATVNSSIEVSGRTGNAPRTASVTVDIAHTRKGDLKVDLVAPDGTLYPIHNRTGGEDDNLSATVERNLSEEPLNGIWQLRVNDNAEKNTGKINAWSITF